MSRASAVKYVSSVAVWCSLLCSDHSGSLRLAVISWFNYARLKWCQLAAMSPVCKCNLSRSGIFIGTVKTWGTFTCVMFASPDSALSVGIFEWRMWVSGWLSLLLWNQFFSSHVNWELTYRYLQISATWIVSAACLLDSLLNKHVFSFKLMDRCADQRRKLHTPVWVVKSLCRRTPWLLTPCKVSTGGHK